MPRLNGFEVLAALTADPLTSTLPVLFITARTRSADKVRGLELGAVDYVTKPFSRAEVLARVQTQLRINQLTRSLVRKQARKLRASKSSQSERFTLDKRMRGSAAALLIKACKGALERVRFRIHLLISGSERKLTLWNLTRFPRVFASRWPSFSSRSQKQTSAPC